MASSCEGSPEGLTPVTISSPCHCGLKATRTETDRDTPLWSCQDLCPTHWLPRPAGTCWFALLHHWGLATHPHNRQLRSPRHRSPGPVVENTGSNSGLSKINKLGLYFKTFFIATLPSPDYCRKPGNRGT